MLHILWLIVKCTGIVLALVLAVVLLAAALVLFCPVRYRGRAERNTEKWQVCARAGWLLGLASVHVTAGSGGSRVQIRLLGIDTAVWKKIFIRKKKKAGKKPGKSLPDRTDIQESEDSRPSQAEIASEKREAPRPEPEISRSVSEKDREEAVPPAAPPRENILKRFWRNVAEKYRSIRGSIQRAVRAFRNLCRTVSLWKEFLGRSQTKAAFGRTWQQLLALLRHAGPQKWKGSIDVGLGNPASTGQLLAVLGASYPIHRSRLWVNPIWDRKVLEGNVQVKGRVYGIMLLWSACRLYFDKNVKASFQWVMGQAGEI